MRRGRRDAISSVASGGGVVWVLMPRRFTVGTSSRGLLSSGPYCTAVVSCFRKALIARQRVPLIEYSGSFREPSHVLARRDRTARRIARLRGRIFLHSGRAWDLPRRSRTLKSLKSFGEFSCILSLALRRICNREIKVCNIGGVLEVFR